MAAHQVKACVKRVKGLRPDLRIAQNRLEYQTVVEITLDSRNCGDCEPAEVTRTESGSRASDSADEKAGAELLGTD